MRGSGAGPVVRVDSGEGAGTTLRGLTLTGGDATDSGATANAGGGLYTSGVPLMVEDVVAIGNRAEFGGGAFFGQATGVRVTASRFEDDDARVGAGLYVYDVVGELRDLVVAGNRATTAEASGYGGGAVQYGGSLTWEDVVFTDNVALTGGGALYVGGIGDATCTNLDALGNSATFGGGVYLSDASTARLALSTVSANAATSIGGGLYVATGATLTLYGARVTANTAPFGAGGMVDGATLVGEHAAFDVNTGDGGGALYVADGTVDLALSVFAQNVAATSNGGAIALDAATGVFENVVFAANEGYSGAAIHVNDGSLAQLTNVTLSEGTSAGSAGGVRVTAAGTLLLDNAIVAYSRQGSGLSTAAGAVVIVTYSDLYGNERGPVSGDVADPTGTNGNVAVDPGFVSFASDGRYADDLHLLATSALVDEGDPLLTDADGTRSDIGAYGGPRGAEWDAGDLDGDGWTTGDGDCNDTDADIHPGAADGCDEIDQDCDGEAWEDCGDSGGDSGDSGGDSGDSGGDSGADSGDSGDSGGEDTGVEPATPAKGCACGTPGTSAPSLALLLGAAALLRRRGAPAEPPRPGTRSA